MEKAVISALDYPCYPKGWELDMMRGCDVGCVYCSLSDSEKIEAVDITHVLDSKERPTGIYLSPNSDPFSNLARENTHKVLERFLPEGVGFVLITKKEIPQKTVELIRKYPMAVVPNITLCRLDPELNKYIERNAATVEERLDTIKRLADAGMNVVVRMTPIFPTVDDDFGVLDEFVGRVARAGAMQVKVAYAVIRDAVALQPIINRMLKHPRLKQAWDAMTETIDIHKGKGNVPPLARRVQLYRDLHTLTQKHGIKLGVCTILDLPLLRMKDIDLGFPLCTNVLANLKSKMDPTFNLKTAIDRPSPT